MINYNSHKTTMTAMMTADYNTIWPRHYSTHLLTIWLNETFIFYYTL